MNFTSDIMKTLAELSENCFSLQVRYQMKQELNADPAFRIRCYQTIILLLIAPVPPGKRDRETERQRDRETERQRDRETERQRDIETDKKRGKQSKKRTYKYYIA